MSQFALCANRGQTERGGARGSTSQEDGCGRALGPLRQDIANVQWWVSRSIIIISYGENQSL